MKTRLFLIFLTSLLCFFAKSQLFNYVHYDIKEGVAGSTVYDMCQDKAGFLWMATENGLTRFDGTTFRNFTVDDGLPDNEVLETFADSKGRVWIGTFSKEVCFYQQGKIFNRYNDSLLSNPILKIQPIFMTEDDKGNVLISDRKKAVLITPDNQITDFNQLPEIKQHSFRNIKARPCFSGGGFLISLNDSIFHYKKDKLSFYAIEKNRPTSSRLFPRYFKVREGSDSSIPEISVPADIVTITSNRGTPIYLSTIDGAWSVDTIQNKLADHFLAGKKISRTLVDHEQNIWFATLGEGVFKLPSTAMRTIDFSDQQSLSNTEVYTILKYNGFVLAGLGASKMGYVKTDQPVKIVDYSLKTRQSQNSLSTNRLYCGFTNNKGVAFLGFDAFLARLENNTTIFADIIALKAIEEVDENYIVVATYENVLKLHQADLKVADTIWRGRCTEVVYNNGKYLVGTMNGLYEVDEHYEKKFLGNLHPAFKRKISDIKKDRNGRLYIATVDMGMLVMQDGKVIHWFNDDNGLSGNICKSVFIDTAYAWVGTSAGISKINLRNYSNIIKYGTSDGLPSDNINAILIDDSTVWVGSPSGLSFFNESKVTSYSQCRLMLEVQTQGSKIADNIYELSYKSPQISFDFVGISYKSGGRIDYHYRVPELDTNWSVTTQNTVGFTALPAGRYTFELYAVNKFGIISETRQIYFSISQPFWKAWWFYLVILLATVLLTAWLVNRRNVKIRERILENDAMQKRYADLEQQALQSTVNPHFIFNSLSSIQQYIQQNDKRKANEFLTGFAYLIRQTLDMSGKAKITLSEEIQYLSNYLKMEIMKHDNMLSCSIKTGEELRSELYEIPPLILQPFVENAISNAVTLQHNSLPVVDIYFSRDDDYIVCSIINNGNLANDQSVAINEYEEYNTEKGIFLAKKRIDLLNELGQMKILVSVKALGGESNTGSQVTIKIPSTIYAGANSVYNY